MAEREALESVSREEVENAAALASSHEDAEGFVWKITLLKDKLVAEHRAQNVSERELLVQFEERTLW
jgi:hypothetical protein